LVKKIFWFLFTLGWDFRSKFAQDLAIWTAHQNNFYPVDGLLETIEKDKKVTFDIDNITTNYQRVDDQLSNKMIKMTLFIMTETLINKVCNSDSCIILQVSKGIGKLNFLDFGLQREFS